MKKQLISFFSVSFVSEPPPAEDAPAEESGPGGLTDADIESNWEEAIEAFDAMDLPEELLRGIYAYGFEKPSAIQQRAIKPTILGKDLIAQAQSGTVSIICGALFAWIGMMILKLPTFESETSHPLCV